MKTAITAYLVEATTRKPLTDAEKKTLWGIRHRLAEAAVGGVDTDLSFAADPETAWRELAADGFAALTRLLAVSTAALEREQRLTQRLAQQVDAARGAQG